MMYNQTKGKEKKNKAATILDAEDYTSSGLLNHVNWLAV